MLRRIAIGVLTAVTLVSLAPSAMARTTEAPRIQIEQQAHKWYPGPCNGWQANVRRGIGWNVIVHRVQWLIRCAEEKWPVPGGTAMAFCIADRESGFNPWAYNPSGASGIFQQMAHYWSGRAAAWLRDKWFYKHQRPTSELSPFMARANVLVSIRMMHTTGLRDWGGGCG